MSGKLPLVRELRAVRDPGRTHRFHRHGHVGEIDRCPVNVSLLFTFDFTLSVNLL